MKKKFDFSGYGTKVNVRCSDGRTIMPDAFKHQNGEIVPLVWEHLHDDPKNVLGHAVLEHREDGVYVYGCFNDSDSGKNAKLLVEHGDIKSLSIHANKLKQKASDVIHGMIREVSLVLAGANSEAMIDNLSFQHSDGSVEIDENEAIIQHNQEIKMEVIETTSDEELKHAEEETIGDVFETLSEKQKTVVYAMIGQALADENNMDHSEGGDSMKTNVFEKKEAVDGKNTLSLTHSDVRAIFTNAEKLGSLKAAVLSHVATYGIEDIDFLFPDARTVTPTPEMITRRMAWVAGVINGTKHSPFSRIKSLAADITADDARAKGYVKGALKKEEIIKLLKRITTPTTVYKKQKLDRDDIIDITDLDVVAWLKAEMRVMLDEELARAVLVGDGREPEDEDKINEDNIRPIYTDDDMYSHHASVPVGATTEDVIDAIVRARDNYEGTGNPAYYTTATLITDMLLLKDTTGRRLYNTETDLAAALRVSALVEVPVMAGLSREEDGDTFDLLGILVNINDYTMGANKGGQVSMFDDFDIDYNQYKYLIETRCCGALTKPKSAVVIEKATA